VLKALGRGLGACAFRDIEVLRAASGAPSLALHESAARLAAEAGVTAWHVSLTHTTTMAEAVVIALGD
jgi:holo-[acyl-carrier protein] synthase